VKYFLVLVAFVLLASIRFMEDHLFYDPLIDFFKGDYTKSLAPEFDYWKTFWNTALRYILNSVISIGIIWLLFSKSTLKFAGFIYALSFIILASVFLWLLKEMSPDLYFLLFYVRRFLIQPLLVLLLVPAFYYQQHTKKAD
jgi:exosortase F-associated protein